MTSEVAVKEWNFNPDEILASPRKVKGIFHQPVIDKDGEIINSKGIRDAVPDFMHLPALHDFHKERPVGLATKVQELGGGRFYMEGVIKATSDCDDVWDKVKSGNYGQMSIFGKRTKYNNQCALPQSMRSGPCVTDGVRLDSISICDDNARNPQTSLEVAKAQVLFDADELRKADIEKGLVTKLAGIAIKHVVGAVREKVDKDYADDQAIKRHNAEQRREAARNKGVIKAETAGDSVLMHATTDYAGGKVRVKKCPKCKEDPVTTISKEEVHKAEGDNQEAPDERPTVRYRPPKEKHVPNEANDPEPRSAYKSRDKSGTKPGKLVRGIRVHSKIEEKESEKKPGGRTTVEGKFSNVHKQHRTPEPESDSGAERRGAASDAVGHYETEARKQKMSEVKPGETKLNVSAKFKKKTTTPGSTEPVERKPEHGAATAGVEAHNAAQRHNAQQTKFDKADTGDEMEKAGVRPTITQEHKGRTEPGRKTGTRKDIEVEPVRHQSRGDGPHQGRFDPEYGKADDEMEKSAAEDLEEDNYDEDDDKEFKHLKPSDKEGNWNKSKNPNGTPGLKKAKADKGPDKEEDEEPEEPEDSEDEEEEEVPKVKKAIRFVDADEDDKKTYADHRKEEKPGAKKPKHPIEKADEVEKSTRTQNLKQKDLGPRTSGGVGHMGKRQLLAWADNGPGDRATGAVGHVEREALHERVKKGDEDGSSELFDPSTVSKGEHMVEYDEEQDVEYVTKALVPIEEIDTIVKARTDEISKAYQSQIETITKAYDEKVAQLASRVQKMEEETIRKGGSIVVIQELLNSDGTGAMSNADAVAQMQAGR